MSDASVQAKYPNAKWFDSNYSGTESGTFDQPYSNIADAISNSGTDPNDDAVVAIKSGDHNVSQISYTKSIRFVGVDKSAVINTTGSGYGGGISGGTIGPNRFLYLETFTLTHNNTANTNGVIQLPGDGGNTDNGLVAQGCRFVAPDARISDSSQWRGWFMCHDASPHSENSLNVTDCEFYTGSQNTSYGMVMGGSGNEDGFGTITFNRCSIYVPSASVSAGKFFYASGTPVTSFTLKNTILVGGNGDEELGIISSSSTLSNNCFYNTSYSSSSSGIGSNNVFDDPLFIDPTNASATSKDFRLRPGSSCINAGTAS